MNDAMPLQDMVDQVIKEAQARVADDQATDEPEEKTASAADQPAEGVDLDYAEKLAGAVSYVVRHFDEVEPEEGEEEKVAEHGNPATALKVLSATKGKQSHDLGGQKMIPTDPPMEEGNKLKSLKSPHKGGGVDLGKKAGAPLTGEDREGLKKAILEKLGSGVDNPPNMGGGPVSDPEGSFKSGDNPKKAPSGGGHQHVASNQAAIDMDKGQAWKATSQPDLGKALAKHKLNRGTDPVLHNNLQNASKAGVKIAGAKRELSKIAAAGCGCDGNGTCSYCRLNILSGGKVATGSEQPAQ